MANKDLQEKPHRIKVLDKTFDWYEDPGGIWILGAGIGLSYTIKWSSIRAALKRKDKK